ncbi:hypothetical protein ABT075_17835 [Streptomyces sp. NPDC002677]|uniref:hypothetical protein n=1 Tax=Streptomyces sp. NPDC002677 TaxID=3154774 RepID=UPI0033346B5C
MLRHENTVLQRQLSSPVQYEPADRLWFAALSSQNGHPETTGLDNDTTLLLDLDGLAVARVERPEDGTRRCT